MWSEQRARTSLFFVAAAAAEENFDQCFVKAKVELVSFEKKNVGVTLAARTTVANAKVPDRVQAVHE